MLLVRVYLLTPFELASSDFLRTRPGCIASMLLPTFSLLSGVKLTYAMSGETSYVYS